MDVIDLLVDATVDSRDEARPVSLGNRALDAYYLELFSRVLPAHVGQFLMRAVLNFSVQQLATRSRVAREREQFLQIGSLDACDFAAGLLNAMPHTIAHWVPGFTSVDASQTADVVEHARPFLPPDGLPNQFTITSQPWQDRLASLAAGTIGLAVVVCDRISDDFAACVAASRARVHQNGRVIACEALLGARRPTAFGTSDFAGRYLMLGAGPMRTLAITVLPGHHVDD
jgi:hypothetical protein